VGASCGSVFYGDAAVFCEKLGLRTLVFCQLFGNISCSFLFDIILFLFLIYLLIYFESKRLSKQKLS